MTVSDHRPKPVQYYKSLKTAKGRREHKAFLLEGPKHILDYIAGGNSPLSLIIDSTKQSELERNYPGLFSSDTGCQVAGPREFSKVTDTITSQGIAAAAAIPACDDFSAGMVVALNGIQDPGNVGTIIRTSAGFGDQQLLLDVGCADPYAPKTVRSSAGAVVKTRIRRAKELAGEIRRLQSNGYRLCTLDPEGDTDIRDVVPGPKLVLAAGSEGRGIEPGVSEMADVRAVIPCRDVESLNAAVAVSIALYELSRKR